MGLWGKGKTFFLVKKSFSLPPHPHPFSKKAGYCRSVVAAGGIKYLSHPNSRSERFTFAARQKLHIAQQCFTQAQACSSHPPPPSFFKKSEVFCRSVVAAEGIKYLSHPNSQSERFISSADDCLKPSPTPGVRIFHARLSPGGYPGSWEPETFHCILF